MKKENIVCVPLQVMQESFDMTQTAWKVGRQDLASLSYIYKDRSEAEKDFSLKQLIPYALLENEKGEILAYSRAGSEKRLSGLKSVGVGGHVNDGDKGENLYDILICGLQRELEEETGLKAHVRDFTLLGMINEEQTEVGHCHTGVVFRIKVANDSGFAFDKEINTPLWIQPEGVKLDEFELWSSLALELVRKPRRKVNIALVGGQPAPVYNVVVATEPDLVVYIYSKTSVKALEALKREIKIDYEPVLLDPVDPNAILECAESLAKKFKDDEVVVNISSGLKSWSHFFGVVFNDKENASVVYMDQNNVLWDYKSMTSTTNFHFDMHSLFRLYGNPLENNYRKFTDYDEADYDCMLQIRQLWSTNKRNFTKYLSLLDQGNKNALENNERGLFYFNDGISFVEWEKADEEQPGFVNLELYNPTIRKVEKLELESKHVTELLFNTNWFEYEVATILNTWDKASEICMNCRFPSRENLDKNEVDIIVNAGSKLLFVECKTQISKITDIDKFRSVVKNYGGTGSKGIFITNAPISAIAKQKCEDNNLLYYSLCNSKSKRKDLSFLFELLDKELYNINTK